MGQDVTVSIGAQPELAPGLSSASNQLDSWAKNTAQRMTTATSPAAKGVTSFTNSIREYVREERAADRTAGFFVRQIAEVAPVSTAARGALTRFGGALLQGGPIGIGIAVGATILGHLVDKYQEAQKAAEEATNTAVQKAGEWAASIAGIDQAFGDFVSRYRDFAKTPEQKFIEAATAPIRSEIAKNEAELASKRAQIAELERRKYLKEDIDEEKLAKLKAEADAVERVGWSLATKLAEEKRVAQEAFPLLDAERQKYEAIEKAAKKAADEAAKLNPGVHEFYVGVPRPGQAFKTEPTVVVNPLLGAKEMQDQGRAAEEVYEATRTAAEKYDIEVRRLDELLRAGVINQDTYNRAVGKAAEAYQQAQAQARQWAEWGAAAFVSIARSAIEGEESLKDTFKRILESFVQMCEQMIAKWLVVQLMTKLGGTGGGGATETPGPGVTAPEIVSSKMALAGAGGTEINFHITTLDAASFDGYLAKNEGVLRKRIGALAYKGRI